MAEEEEDEVTGALAVEASAASAAAASGGALVGVGLSTGDDAEECIRTMYESVKKTFAETFFDACGMWRWERGRTRAQGGSRKEEGGEGGRRGWGYGGGSRLTVVVAMLELLQWIAQTRDGASVGRQASRAFVVCALLSWVRPFNSRLSVDLPSCH